MTKDRRVGWIHPEVFLDENLSELPIGATLLFLGLTCLADSRTRLVKASPRYILAVTLGMRDEVTTDDVAEWLDALVSVGRLERVSVDGEPFLRVPDLNRFLSARPKWDAETGQYADVLRHDPCTYCGKTGERMHVDHIRPFIDGGRHHWENLTACCRSCNSRKHTTGLLQFLATRPWAREPGGA